MKRIVLILLVVLLLAGCGVKEEITPTETEPVVEVTEPVSIYLPNSSVEQQTKGAVKVFVPEEANYIGMAAMNGDVVLASAKRLRAAPGEMEKLVVKADLLKNVTEDITVSLEVVE